MVSIHKVPSKGGQVYVFLKESMRINGKSKSFVVKNFGSYDNLVKDNPNAYEELREKAKRGEIEYESRKSTIQTTINLEEDLTHTPLMNYGCKVIESFYEMLNISSLVEKYSENYKFNYSLDKILQLLIIGRILSPASKINTVDVFQKELFGNWNISQNDMYRALDHLNNLKEELQILIHKQITNMTGRTASLVFYDITNYWFETDIPDDFRKRGYSKENRKDPIIQLGLFMDSNSIPIAYKIFEGNCSDPKTYIPAIEQVKKQFGIERIVTVADKAMNSSNNIMDTIAKKDGYLFSSKFRGKTGSRKDLQAFVLDTNGWQYNKLETFAKKSTILTRKLANGKTVKEKVVVTWKHKYSVREKIRRNGAIEYVEKLNTSQMKRVLIGKNEAKYYDVKMVDDKTGEKINLSPLICIDNEKVSFDELFDGMNVITTSELHMTDDEIIANYKQLSKIEDCFRVTKTDLKSRPVFVWTREHIEAHFLTCYIALVIIKMLRYITNDTMSSGRMKKAMQSAVCKHITGDYYDVSANEDFILLLDKLGVEWNKRNVSKGVIESIVKNVINTPLK